MLSKDRGEMGSRSLKGLGWHSRLVVLGMRPSAFRALWSSGLGVQDLRLKFLDFRLLGPGGLPIGSLVVPCWDYFIGS